MPTLTGQQIVTNALTTLGIVPQGGTPSTSDSSDALNELNAMTDGWGVDNGLIYSVAPVTVTAPTTSAGHALASAISRLFGAQYVDAGGRSWPLTIVDQDRYRNHYDLGASSSISPEELYWDSGGPPGNIFTWPVTSAGNVLLQVGVQFSAFTLGGSVSLIPAYQDAINYGLALRLIPRFGEIVTQAIQQYVTAQAQLSMDRVRAANTANRQLQPPLVGANPAAQEAVAAQGH